MIQSVDDPIAKYLPELRQKDKFQFNYIKEPADNVIWFKIC
jgi:hypothetical protein